MFFFAKFSTKLFRGEKTHISSVQTPQVRESKKQTILRFLLKRQSGMAMREQLQNYSPKYLCRSVRNFV